MKVFTLIITTALFPVVILASTQNLKTRVDSLPKTQASAVRAKRAVDPITAQIAGAAVDKAIDKGAELAEEQMKIYDEQRDKAHNFLKKRINLNLDSSTGWNMSDLFVPPGYNLHAGEEDDTGAEDEENERLEEDPPYNYASGFIGPSIMNGCYGNGYQPGDPCYAPMENTTQCREMMEAAGFIGVGFDAREDYSPESRRMSIIQRNCGAKGSFGDEQVPDTMNVHGIFDTSATQTTFESRSEYQEYLQQEAGVSGSFFGFYGGVKTAWGSSSSSSSQSFLSIFDVDVTRYEIFQDEVKPSDLSQSFLLEFMNLPTSYFAPGAALCFNFIQRWGTHYIKSAMFGGRLEFRKMMQGSSIQTKSEASVEAEVEFRGLFFSAGAKYGRKEGSSSKSEQKSSSTALVVQGGSQEIASILSDTYSPTFKNEFKIWLRSIPKYPKAFKFRMAPITDLLDFRAGDLFPDKYTLGCDTDQLLLEEGQPYYTKGSGEKVYCDYSGREDLEQQIQNRVRSLKRAVEVYMEEGPKSADVNIKAGNPGCQTNGLHLTADEPYATFTAGHALPVEVKFDMRHPIVGVKTVIDPDMKRLIKYKDNKWFTSEPNDRFRLYNAYPTDGDFTSSKMVSVKGLIMEYSDTTGMLDMTYNSYQKSLTFFPNLKEELVGMALAVIRRPTTVISNPAPCNVRWENMNMFQRTKEGKCLQFTASSVGPIYVVFAVIPNRNSSWYYIEISPYRVAMFKHNELLTSTTNRNAVGLGDAKLFQTYFVCIKEAEKSTVIEYGKTHGTSRTGAVYMSTIDRDHPLKSAYYAFGVGESALQVTNIHVIEGRGLLQTECRGTTNKEKRTGSCVPQACHEFCDPLQGCTAENDPAQCEGCEFAKDNGVCVAECPGGKRAVGDDKECITFDFNFPSAGVITDYVLHEGTLPDLRAVTASVWVKTNIADTSHGATMISYATEDNNNEMTLYNPRALKFGIQNIFFTANNINVNDNQWHHIYVTWQSSDGRTEMYKDGVRKLHGNMLTGQMIRTGGVLVIGQEQDNVGGLFDRKQNFAGRLTSVNIWDRVLSAAERSELTNSCSAGAGNIYDWAEAYVSDTFKGNVKHESPSTCAVPDKRSKIGIPAKWRQAFYGE